MAQQLRLATTTSPQYSGLLNYLLPDFEKKYNTQVQVIAVGTGQALELGEKGNADVVLVHARVQEDEFVASGYGTTRYDVMYNDFIIVGPSSDPSGIKGMTSAVQSFAKIAKAQHPFVSRSDNSGTHIKETSLWTEARVSPSGSWYVSAGQGMGEILITANKMQGYALTDRATFAVQKAQGLNLEILVEGDRALFNPYGVIPVNSKKHSDVHEKLAQDFVGWITSLETQKMIADYRVNGQQLFVPDSDAWRKVKAGAMPK